MKKLERYRLKTAKIAAKSILGISCRLMIVHYDFDKDINLYQFTRGYFIVNVKVDKDCNVVYTELNTLGDIDNITNVTDSEIEKRIQEHLTNAEPPRA